MSRGRTENGKDFTLPLEYKRWCRILIYVVIGPKPFTRTRFHGVKDVVAKWFMEYCHGNFSSIHVDACASHGFNTDLRLGLTQAVNMTYV